DQEFGTGGRVIADFSTNYYDGASCVVIQPDGKILAAGARLSLDDQSISINNIVLARFHPDGSPDSSFGEAGRVVTDIPGRVNESAEDVILQKDGKILLAAGSGAGSNQFFTLLRYQPDGTLDSTFGNKGIRTTLFEGNPTSMILQPDGKILLGGDTMQVNESCDLAVVRFLPDGKTDTAFGIKGRVLADFGRFDPASSMALADDGRIVMAGNHVENFVYRPALACWLPDGSPDPDFGENGRMSPDLGDAVQNAQTVLLRADGGIMLAVSAVSGNTAYPALAGLLRNGAPDPSFGVGGLLKGIGGEEGYSFSSGLMAGQADGRMVVAGFSSSRTYQHDFFVARFSNAPRPGVVTLNASDVTAGSAMLRAAVNAGGGGTLVTFEYREEGETDFHNAMASPVMVTGTDETTVEATLSGLKRNTVYHYRAKGVNEAAAVTGNEPFFRTLTWLEAWRRTYFGSSRNSGDGADTQDFDHDGLVNLMEWSLGTNPGESSIPPYHLSLTDAGLEFIHPRRLQALEEGILFTVEWSQDPAGPWTSAGVADSVIASDTVVQNVKSLIPMRDMDHCFVRLKVAVP
ncbi:MAG: hypothetical protein EOP86_13475, partial [Verrucomicrobiaceae bacterium]